MISYLLRVDKIKKGVLRVASKGSKRFELDGFSFFFSFMEELIQKPFIFLILFSLLDITYGHMRGLCFGLTL